MGLTEVADAVGEEMGELALATGDGFVLRTAFGQTSGSQAIDLPGVQIALSFPER